MLKIAKALSDKSDHREYKHSAIVVKGGNILSVGFNKGKKHAEIHALRHGPYPKATLYSFRFTSSGYGNSKPCKKCWEVLRFSAIRDVIYFQRGLGFVRRRV